MRSIQLLVLLLCTAHPLSAQDPNKIIERFIDATGGIDALTSLKSVRAKGTFAMNGVEFPLHMAVQRPGRAYLRLSCNGIDTIRATDGETYWGVDPLKERFSPYLLSEEEIRDLRNVSGVEDNLPANWAKGHQVRLEGEEDVEGKASYKLRLTRPDGRVAFFWIDQQTYLLVKRSEMVDGPQGQVENETSFAKFLEIDGVTIPTRFTSRQDGIAFEMELNEVELNAEIDEEIFRMPSPPSDPDSASDYLAWKIEDTVGQGDCSYLDDRFSLDRLIVGLLKKDIDPAYLAGFVRGFRSSFSFGRQICQLLGEDGSYRLVRIHREGGQHRALFRLASQGGLNYHDFLLQLGPDANFVITDVYIYALGENLSDSFDRMLDLFGGVAEDRQEIMRKLHQASQVQDYEQIIDLFPQLPEEFKKDKGFLVLRLTAALKLGDDQEYDKAALLFEEEYSDDPTLHLILYSSALARQDYEAAIESLQRLDEALQGDPYLQLERAEVYSLAGRYAEARAAAQRLVDDPAWAEPAHWTLVGISLTAKDFAETRRLLLAIESNWGLEISDLEEFELYPEFAASSEHERWIQERKER